MVAKTERNEQIIAALNLHTASEVARMFGITRQRVDQIVKAMGGYPSEHRNYLSEIHRAIEPYLGKAPDSEVARLFKTTLAIVRHRRIMLGVQPHYKTRPDKCAKCALEPYARGMCRRCYNRWLRKRNAP